LSPYTSPNLFTPGGAQGPDTLSPFVSVFGYCLCPTIHLFLSLPSFSKLSVVVQLWWLVLGI